MKSILSKARGITLIALVITIIIIIILAGITINLTVGENGIFTKSKQAREAYQKQTAKETINLKITNIQMETYAKEQRLPTLKNIADAFCRDGDFEHVTEVSQRRASNDEGPFLLPEIQNANPSSIFVELKAYPYEFEIDNQLRLASIDGEKIANSEPMGNYASQSDYEELNGKYNQLQTNYNTLSEKLKDYDKLVKKVEDLEKNEGASTYTITPLYNGNPIASGNITFSNNKSIDDFDAIKFLIGNNISGGYNAFTESQFTKESWNYIVEKGEKTSNFETLLAAAGSEYFMINNVSKTGFTIKTVNGRALYQIYGINY